MGSCQLFFTAPMVRFLRERLEKAGCAVGENFFKAITCNQEVAGSYVRGEGVLISLFIYFSCLFFSIQVNCNCALKGNFVLTMFNLLLCWKVRMMVLHVQLRNWLNFCLMKKISSQFYCCFVVSLVELVLWSMLLLWLDGKVCNWLVFISFYVVPFSQVKVCSNYVRIQDYVNQVIIRELIHAFDDCRAANLDWSDCAHHACTEVRILLYVPIRIMLVSYNFYPLISIFLWYCETGTN